LLPMSVHASSLPMLSMPCHRQYETRRASMTSRDSQRAPPRPYMASPRRRGMECAEALRMTDASSHPTAQSSLGSRGQKSTALRGAATPPPDSQLSTADRELLADPTASRLRNAHCKSLSELANSEACRAGGGAYPPTVRTRNICAENTPTGILPLVRNAAVLQVSICRHRP
jgi:hypothetical protein